MVLFPASTQDRVRSRLILVVLACAVAASAALTWEAYVSTRSHRLAAEAALRDYAGFAAAEFSAKAGDHLAMVASMAFMTPHQLATHRASGASLAPPAVIGNSLRMMRNCNCGAMLPALYYFRLDPPSLTMSTDGGKPPAPVARWIIDTLTKRTLATDSAGRFEAAYIFGEAG